MHKRCLFISTNRRVRYLAVEEKAQLVVHPFFQFEQPFDGFPVVSLRELGAFDSRASRRAVESDFGLRCHRGRIESQMRVR